MESVKSRGSGFKNGLKSCLLFAGISLLVHAFEGRQFGTFGLREKPEINKGAEEFSRELFFFHLTNGKRFSDGALERSALANCVSEKIKGEMRLRGRPTRGTRVRNPICLGGVRRGGRAEVAPELSREN